MIARWCACFQRYVIQDSNSHGRNSSGYVRSLIREIHLDDLRKACFPLKTVSGRIRQRSSIEILKWSLSRPVIDAFYNYHLLFHFGLGLFPLSSRTAFPCHLFEFASSSLGHVW